MSRMAETLWNISDPDSAQDKFVEVYWILTGFLNQIQKYSNEIARLQECTNTMLEREDKELHAHLINIDVLQALPYDTWFHSCFAGTISDGSIHKYERSLKV